MLTVEEFLRFFDGNAASASPLAISVSEWARRFKAQVSAEVSALQSSFSHIQVAPAVVHGTHKYRFSIDLYSVKVAFPSYCPPPA